MKIEWTNFGKTAIGLIQIGVGVGIHVGAAKFPPLAALSPYGQGLIVAGLGAFGIGICHKATRAKKGAKPIPSPPRIIGR
jgi:hypothetical protein